MASSHRAEERADFIGLIHRLRANSSLVLVALEHDDMRRLQELVQECDGLIKDIVAHREGELPEDITALIDQVVKTNRRVVAELEGRKLEVARQLADVRTQRSKVRLASQTTRNAIPTGRIDRLT